MKRTIPQGEMKYIEVKINLIPAEKAVPANSNWILIRGRLADGSLVVTPGYYVAATGRFFDGVDFEMDDVTHWGALPAVGRDCLIHGGLPYDGVPGGPLPVSPPIEDSDTD